MDETFHFIHLKFNNPINLLYYYEYLIDRIIMFLCLKMSLFKRDITNLELVCKAIDVT